MKKKYTEPQTVIVSVNHDGALLVTSGDVYGGGVANGPELIDSESMSEMNALLNDWQQEIDRYFDRN